MVKMLFKYFRVKYFDGEEWNEEKLSTYQFAKELYEKIKREVPSIRHLYLEEIGIVEYDGGWLNEKSKLIEENKTERRK